MEVKKNKNVDIHRFSGLFFQIGLVLSLAMVVIAFEWRSSDDGSTVDLGSLQEFEDIIDIPNTIQPPPPPPVIQQPQIIEVPDEEEIEEEIEVDLDIEVTEETVIEELVFEDAPEEEVADEVFTIVEENPVPVGGMNAFYRYVATYLIYPEIARRMGIEGNVFIEFVVEKDGTITAVKSIKGIGAGCDEEAVKVIIKAPKWKPGKQRGRAVRVRVVLPIHFRLS